MVQEDRIYFVVNDDIFQFKIYINFLIFKNHLCKKVP